MDHVGVVVNPIAGMGGRVGLKGTDDRLDEAIDRGADPRAPGRALEALEAIHRRKPDVRVSAAAGVMGAGPARAAGFDPEVVYEPDGDAGDPTDPDPDELGGTTAADTRAAVRELLDRGVDLVLFVGGDGTAVDVAAVLEERDAETPMLGVPAGVKIYSSVFGVTPAEAGRIAVEFDRVADREVNDIDEAAYREGEVRTELQAVVPVPVADAVQSSKQLSGGSVDALAEGFARDVEDGTTYVFGPGSTVGAIEEELGIDPSPLGVDVWRDGDLLVRDGAESALLEAIAEPTVIVVSPIGGQGFLFGRGNHQLSPAVVRRASEIEVVASDEKLAGVGRLRVDTDDEDLDERLRGWIHVRTGRFRTRMAKVV